MNFIFTLLLEEGMSVIRWSRPCTLKVVHFTIGSSYASSDRKYIVNVKDTADYTGLDKVL